MKSDKDLERERYENRAQDILSGNLAETEVRFIDTLSPALQAPYRIYESYIKELVSDRNMKVLEIGAGTGRFTEMALMTGAQVVATDISRTPLEVLLGRLKNYENLAIQVADMESLPFENESFDFVLNAGSLSYGDNTIVMNEIYRVLGKGGTFICVDSLNHNPFYQFNRWLQYLRKERSRSTIDRMPSKRLIKAYANKFGLTKVHYFGAIIWSTPLLNIFMSEKKIGQISNRVDELFNVSSAAFKFVMVVEKVAK